RERRDRRGPRSGRWRVLRVSGRQRDREAPRPRHRDRGAGPDARHRRDPVEERVVHPGRPLEPGGGRGRVDVGRRDEHRTVDDRHGREQSRDRERLGYGRTARFGRRRRRRGRRGGASGGQDDEGECGEQNTSHVSRRYPTSGDPPAAPDQWKKWRSPVKYIVTPADCAAAMTSSSRTEPPGWTIAVTPA